MNNAFEVGDRVRIVVDDLPYAGTVITYDNSIYYISVDGLGKIVFAEESDLETLN